MNNNINGSKANGYVMASSMIVIIIYLITTVVIYFVSVRNGNGGVDLSILGNNNGDDGVLYWYQIASNYNLNNPFNENLTGTLYVPIMSYISLKLNVLSPLVIRIINIFPLIILVVQLSHIYKSISDELSLNLNHEKSLSLFMLLIYPSLIMMLTFSLYRDIWIYAFFLCSISYFCKLIMREKVITNILLFVISVLILYGFRAYAAISILLSIFVFLLFKTMKKYKIFFITSLLLGIVIFYVLPNYKFPFINKSFQDVLNYREGILPSSMPSNQYQLLREGGSDFGPIFSRTNYLLFLLEYLYSIFTNVLGPFVWQIRSLSPMLILPESVFCISSICTMMKNKNKFIQLYKKSKCVRFLMINVFIYSGVIGLFNKNLGTASRLRVPIMVIILIIFMTYLKFSKEKNYES